MIAVVSFACGVSMSVAIAVIALGGAWWVAKYDDRPERDA